jgi:hypothetical protein
LASLLPSLNLNPILYKDSFFVVEYLGHPLSRIPNRLQEVSLQNSVKTLPVGEAIPGVTNDVAGGYEYYGFIDSPNRSKGILQEIKIKEAVRLVNYINASKTSGDIRGNYIPSLFPGDIGKKVTELVVDLNATTGVPETLITFRGITKEDLDYDSSDGFTWHNRGAGYRVWMGTISGIDSLKKFSKEDLEVVFEGFVNAADYGYAKEGIELSLRLNNHKSVFLRKPLKERLWDNCSTILKLIQKIGLYLGIVDENKIVVNFDFKEDNKELKDKIDRLYGVKDPDDESIGFFVDNVKSKLDLLITDETLELPTPADLLNLMANLEDIHFRWHLTTDGELFFGLPENPNKFTVMDVDRVKKRFIYREQAKTLFTGMDIFESDYFESVQLFEVERVEYPEESEAVLSILNGTIDKPDEDTNPMPASVEGNEATDGFIYKYTRKNNVTGETDRAGNEIKVSGRVVYLQPKEVEQIREFSDSYGNVAIEIDGCMIDPRLKPMDYIYFKGYKDHTGVYLVTNVTYSFSSGSKGTMRIRAIKPISVDEFKKVNPMVVLNKTNVEKSAEPGETNNMNHKIQFNEQTDGNLVTYQVSAEGD